MSAMASMTKWGNGVGLLISKSARDDSGICLGGRVRMKARDGCIRICREDAGWTLHNLMQGYDGPPPEYVDLGEPYGKELWL